MSGLLVGGDRFRSLFLTEPGLSDQLDVVWICTRLPAAGCQSRDQHKLGVYLDVKNVGTHGAGLQSKNPEGRKTQLKTTSAAEGGSCRAP